jgi:sterol desaturase/sphingolipid hydroxylase (fatty acid hydroxylase superfamily)
MAGLVPSLNSLYKKLHDTMKGDKGNITLLTVAVLCLSEIPMLTFTLLDILKLKSVFPYRLHYDPDHASHLGQRKYPPLDLILQTAKVAERNFLLAYIVPATVLIKLGAKLGIYVYDTEEDEKKVTWRRIIKETFMISVLADFLFYGLHRLMHTARFYKIHKIHHEFKYSIAMAHHYMELVEAVIFALPQALPPLFLWAATGQRMHIISMWLGVFYTQTSAILGHAGYRIPFIPSWLPILQASYHDLHHVDYKVNFGAIYPLTDMLFGTYVNAKLDKGVKVPVDGNITMKAGAGLLR